jgi:hypothetical protein
VKSALLVSPDSRCRERPRCSLLGVAADREALGDPVDLRRSGTHPCTLSSGLLLGHAHLLARARELVGEQIDLALQLVDAVALGELRVVGGGRRDRQRREQRSRQARESRRTGS